MIKTAVKIVMKKLYLSVSFLLIIVISASFAADVARGQTRSKTIKKPVPAKPAEKPLPDLKLSDIKGVRWSLYENRGRIVLMNFWATWCAPCRAEMPMLVKLSKEYKARGLEIVGIALDDDDGAGNIEKFIADYKIGYTILLPVPDSLLAQTNPIPMTLLIDTKSRLAKKYVGLIPEKILRADIKKLIDN